MVSRRAVSGKINAFEYTGPGFMLPSLTPARRPRLRWPTGLLVVILTLIPALAPCTLKAQATTPQEITSRDVEPTFKLQSERNLVQVRVVVRDGKGATVDSLRQEDFRLFDHGKLQTIVHFSLEKPALKAPEPLPSKPATTWSSVTKRPDSEMQKAEPDPPA